MFYILAFIITMMIAVPWIVMMAIPLMVMLGAPFTVIVAKSKSAYATREENARVSLFVLEDGKFPALPLVNALADRHYINVKKIDVSLTGDKLPASEVVDVLKGGSDGEFRDLIEKIPVLYIKDSETKYGELEVKQ